MRFSLWMIGFAALCGCDMPSEQVSVAPEQARHALFDSYPDAFFAAARRACHGPQRNLKVARDHEILCEVMPNPQTAAAVIIAYDGIVSDVPTFFMSFRGRDVARGYLVTMDSYIRVPQRDGRTVQLRFPDPSIEARMDRLLRNAGGRPVIVE